MGGKDVEPTEGTPINEVSNDQLVVHVIRVRALYSEGAMVAKPELNPDKVPSPVEEEDNS